MHRQTRCLLLAVTLITILGTAPAATAADEKAAVQVPVKGMVTLLDLGADRCIPCKMMMPIMQRMEKRYRGKAAILFIDVWKHHDQAMHFGIRAIPTQIFFDAHGREVYRHIGFMKAEQIAHQLQKMGVE